MRFSLLFSCLLILLSFTACKTSDTLSSSLHSAKQNQTSIINSAQPTQSALPALSQTPLSPSLNAPALSVMPAPNVATTASKYALQNIQAGNPIGNAQIGGSGTARVAEIDLNQTAIQNANLPYVPLRPRTQKTYLINGLMSAIPFIGFGFRNLHKKMPEAQLYSYLSPVESAAVILPKVMKDIQAAHAKDPNVKINLIGISLGADFVSIVAEKLHRKNIQVNYLGIVDGTSLRPVQSNVKKVDNLTCTYLDCVRGKVRLAKGNTTTVFIKKKYKSSHIPLGNNNDLHNRVIAQSRS